MKKFNNWPTDYPDPNWFIHDRFGLFIHFACSVWELDTNGL